MAVIKKEMRIVATYRIGKSIKEAAEARAAEEGTTLSVEVERFVTRYSNKKRKQDAENAGNGKHRK